MIPIARKLIQHWVSAILVPMILLYGGIAFLIPRANKIFLSGSYLMLVFIFASIRTGYMVLSRHSVRYSESPGLFCTAVAVNAAIAIAFFWVAFI
jgi:hypothetical protein